MKISRIVVKNYRAFGTLDINVEDNLCCILGENNTGKTALLRAIQICLDISLPSSYRSLIREDINTALDISEPSQVLIGVEFADFRGSVNEEALVSTWKTGPDSARIFYRFRPRLSIREKIENEEIDPNSLTLEDYAWEIRGGGNPDIDLIDIEWDDEGIGESVRFSDLQSFLLVHLPALRDVENDIRNVRQSPLIKLIEAFDVPEEEQDGLIAILDAANADIANSKTIAKIASAIDKRFKNVSGPAFEMDATLGVSAATFRAILRNLKLILSDQSLKEFEPGRNGLGMNNILYIAILLEYLKKRISQGKSSGQLVLLEEPESHLHPQLQYALISALKDVGVQILVTSHSTQLTSRVPLSSIVSLTKRDDGSISAGNLALNAELTEGEVADLERYLDSTKSNLLYARRVMLVEGPAELFLIPALIEHIFGVNLEREGISLVAIHGVHFDIYAKLFAKGSLEKRCAIVADADLAPSDASTGFEAAIDADDLKKLETKYIKVFLGATTFERELVSVGTLPMFIKTTRSLGASQITSALEQGLKDLKSGHLDDDESDQLLSELADSVLKTAKRFGKARFAQVASRYVNKATSIPPYIKDAYDWLRQ